MIKTLHMWYRSSINMSGGKHFTYLLTGRVQNYHTVPSNSGTLSDPFMKGRGEYVCSLQIVLKCFQGLCVQSLIIVSPVYSCSHIQVIRHFQVQLYCTTFRSFNYGIQTRMLSPFQCPSQGDKWPRLRNYSWTSV